MSITPHARITQPRPPIQPPGCATLEGAPIGQPATVLAIQSPVAAPEWGERLEEIGFFPGERVTVMVRGLPGGDPLVVRVGNSTFALRRAEAACVQIEDVPR